MKPGSPQTIPESIASGTFLLVASGEVYFTETVPGRDLANRIMAATCGEQPSGWDLEELAFWQKQVFDPDQWSHNPDVGPTQWSTDIGEMDHIDFIRLHPL